MSKLPHVVEMNNLMMRNIYCCSLFALNCTDLTGFDDYEIFNSVKAEERANPVETTVN